MMNDRFNEMYLKIVKAKGLENKRIFSEALKIYLEVISDYNPGDDFVYRRACELSLELKGSDEAKSIALTALKKIKEDEIEGSPVFFMDFIKVLETEEEAAKKLRKRSQTGKGLSLHFFEKKRNTLFLGVLIVFLILISLPDKIFKLIFLVFAVLSFVFLLEIIEDLKHRFSVKTKTTLLLFSLFLSIYGVAKMPPSNWNDFISIPSFQFKQSAMTSESNAPKGKAPKAGRAGEKKASDTGKASKDKNAEKYEISDKDLDLLDSFNEQEILLESHKLTQSGDTIFLSLKLKAGATEADGKQIALSTLENLSLIKGFQDEEDGGLGALYKNYEVKIEVKNSVGEKILSGKSNKGTRTIFWKIES